MNKVYNLICSAGTATVTMTDDGVVYTAHDKENNIIKSKSVAVTEMIQYKGIDSVASNAGMVGRSGIEILVGILAFGALAVALLMLCLSGYPLAMLIGTPGALLLVLWFYILGKCNPHTEYTVNITYSGFNRTLSFLTEADMQEFYSELIRKVG